MTTLRTASAPRSVSLAPVVMTMEVSAPAKAAAPASVPTPDRPTTTTSTPVRTASAESAHSAMLMQRHSIHAGLMQSRITRSLPERDDVKSQGGRVSLDTDEDAKAEERVAKGNTIHGKTFTGATLQTDLVARKEFVSGMTQVDGDKSTSIDTRTCGPMALLGGMMLKDPSSVQKLAGKLKDDKRVKNDPAFRQALERIHSGKYSPSDVRTLAEVMSRKYINVSNGASTDEMMKLVGKCREMLGNDMPDVVLHRYSSTKDPAGGSHWQAYANGIEYDPWPGEDGKAVLTEGNKGLAHGGGHYTDGGVHTKIFVKEHGKKLTIERYTGADKSGKVHTNQQKPVATYEYEMKDWFGYNYTRTATTGITLDPKEEPGRTETDPTVVV
ncbi:MAG: hypothetical protein AB2A00_33550 [Myxococcota bacterium]